jgi:hypothetical protein
MGGSNRFCRSSSACAGGVGVVDINSFGDLQRHAQATVGDRIIERVARILWIGSFGGLSCARGIGVDARDLLSRVSAATSSAS